MCRILCPFRAWLLSSIEEGGFAGRLDGFCWIALAVTAGQVDACFEVGCGSGGQVSSCGAPLSWPAKLLF